MEKFKDVKGYKGLYNIGSLGSVRSLITNKILKPSKISTGYLQVILVDKKVKSSRTVHRLVAESFLNHTTNRIMVIDHIDENKQNNKLSNLRIIPTRYNSARGKKNVSSKYLGVCWNKLNRKWISSIQLNGDNKYLGSFKCEKIAHSIYCENLPKDI